MKERFVAWRNNEKKLSHRKRSFSEEIFASSPWYLSLRNDSSTGLNTNFVSQKIELKETVAQEVPAQTEQADAQQSLVASENISEEKVKTIESLKNFVTKTSEKQGKDVINFEGTQLKIKSGKASSQSFTNHELASKEVSVEWAFQFEAEGWKPKKLSELEKSENQLLLLVDPKDDEEFFSHNEILSGEKWKLLHKMIGAMNLQDYQILIPDFFENDSKNLLDSVLSFYLEYKPKTTLAFGASCVNQLTGRPVRLTDVHGQLLDKTFLFGEENFSLKFYPIFHPEFLIINPKMKRTAWVDLQKVMEFLGNSST